MLVEGSLTWQSDLLRLMKSVIANYARTPPKTAQKSNIDEFFLSFENVMAKFQSLFAYSGTASSCNFEHSDWFFTGQDFAIPVQVEGTLHV